MQLVPTVVILGVLIFVHEFGHFLACRLVGVKVEKFSIGFGSELIAWQGKETRYAISFFPFGGFVKPQGESEEEVRKHGVSREGDFLSASPLSRMIIVLAGVVMNFLLAYVLFAYVFVVGRPMTGTTIAGLVDGYPAQVSGLQAGDRILTVNQAAVKNWQELLYEISKSTGTPLTFSIDRAGVQQQITVVPKIEAGKDLFGVERKVAKIGIKPDMKTPVIERYGLSQALVEAYRLELKLTSMTFEAIWKLVTGQLSFKTVSGPIGIASMAADVTRMGVVAVLQFTAILSVSLAVVNVLPIPALDGGHFLFLLPEVLFRRRLSLVFEERAHQVGYVALIVLIVLVAFNDLSNIGIYKKIAAWIDKTMPAFPDW